MKLKCLVLNLDYTPINIITAQRAYCIYFKNHATIIDFHDEKYGYKSLHGIIKMPSIIRINVYHKIPFRKTVLSKHNILKRDKNKCVYCGSTKNLTIDHVIPRAKGGKDSWGNLVTCCDRCNNKKGSNILSKDELQKLKIMLYEPHHLIHFQNLSNKIPDEWKDYLFLKR